MPILFFVPVICILMNQTSEPPKVIEGKGVVECDDTGACASSKDVKLVEDK